MTLRGVALTIVATVLADWPALMRRRFRSRHGTARPLDQRGLGVPCDATCTPEVTNA